MTMAVDVRRAADEDGGGAMVHRPNGDGAMAIATTRASQEVQAAMVVAKRFPRDETAAITRILQACKRKGLAEAAIYSYPRGSTTVEGPSIRLAEAMAQAWGNIDFGIVELEQKNGESQVMAYAWDLETNARQTKIFAVPHKRHTRNGDMRLTDPRDIYEMVANNGARRLRACILGIIPGDVQDQAVEQCNRTLQNAGGGEPLIDRVRRMISGFADLGVTQAMIEARINHKAETISYPEFVQLGKIHKSIMDGAGKREDFFDLKAGEPASEVGSRTETLADTLKKQHQTPAGGAEAISKDEASSEETKGQQSTSDDRPAGGRPRARNGNAPQASQAAAPKPDVNAVHEDCMNKAAEWADSKSPDEWRTYIVGFKDQNLVKGALRMAQVKSIPSDEKDLRAVVENLKTAELMLAAGIKPQSE